MKALPGIPTVERIMAGDGPVWVARPYIVSFFEIDIRDGRGGRISREEFAARIDDLVAERRASMLAVYDSHTKEAA